MHYRPAAGIEEYLRERWAAIKGRKIAHIEGATDAEVHPGQSPASSLSEWSKLDPDSAIQAAMMSPLIWFSGFARIVDKDERLTPPGDWIRPSVAQIRAFEAYQWCIDNKQPVRLIFGPKARQSYMSTTAAAICLVHSRRFKLTGMMIGDEVDRTEGLWRMFNHMAATDRLKDRWGISHDFNSERATFKYSDGRQNRVFQWGRDTANDRYAGSSGTRQILWFSEAGLYSKSGVVTDAQVISNAMNSVPNTPETVVIMESVAGGASGYFFQSVKGASTLAERKAGQFGNGWIKIFCAWWEVPDYAIRRDDHNGDLFRPELTERERRGIALYSWTANQIAWRRAKLKEIGEDEARFDEEYPESEDVAFRTSGSPRFNEDGMNRLEVAAAVNHRQAKMGSFSDNGGKIQFIQGEPEWLWLREAPMFGAKYIVFGDFMTAEQSAGSIKRDEHAVGVWRAPYTDPGGNPHGPKLVAAITSPIGVRWDTDIIADKTHLLSKYFGGCIIVIETNRAWGMLTRLLNSGANIWKRSKDDRIVPGQTVKIPGWQTTEQTRPLVVDAMAEFVRDDTGECDFLPMVKQIKTFIVDVHGKAQAAPSEFDDWVMGGGIGLVCIESATEYAHPRPVLPRGNLEPREGVHSAKGDAAFG